MRKKQEPKKIYKTGDIIPVGELTEDILKHVAQPLHVARQGVELAQEIYYRKLEDFREVIEEKYPELKNRMLRYNHVEGFILIGGEKPKLPPMSKYFPKDQN